MRIPIRNTWKNRLASELHVQYAQKKHDKNTLNLLNFTTIKIFQAQRNSYGQNIRTQKAIFGVYAKHASRKIRI